jgi:hypothetical protein
MSCAAAANSPVYNNNTPTSAATQQVNTAFSGFSAPQHSAHNPTAVGIDINHFFDGQINSLTKLLEAANEREQRMAKHIHTLEQENRDLRASPLLQGQQPPPPQQRPPPPQPHSFLKSGDE